MPDTEEKKHVHDAQERFRAITVRLPPKMAADLDAYAMQLAERVGVRIDRARSMAVRELLQNQLQEKNRRR